MELLLKNIIQNEFFMYLKAHTNLNIQKFISFYQRYSKSDLLTSQNKNIQLISVKNTQKHKITPCYQMLLV